MIFSRCLSPISWLLRTRISMVTTIITLSVPKVRTELGKMAAAPAASNYLQKDLKMTELVSQHTFKITPENPEKQQVCQETSSSNHQTFKNTR